MRRGSSRITRSRRSRNSPPPPEARAPVPRSGYAHLPLHTGKAPRYLFERMVPLSLEIVSFIALHHGRDEVLRRLADPYWFQAFGCVLGFDWHSSGLTTTACGALK